MCVGMKETASYCSEKRCKPSIVLSPQFYATNAAKSESTRLPMISGNIVIKMYSEGRAISVETYPFFKSRFPFRRCRSRGPPTKSVGKRDTPIYSRLNLEVCFRLKPTYLPTPKYDVSRE